MTTGESLLLWMALWLLWGLLSIIWVLRKY